MGFALDFCARKLSDNADFSSPFGFVDLNTLSNEGLQQYWDELEQKANLPLRLKTLIENTKNIDSKGCYQERFAFLADQLRDRYAIPLPPGIYPVARAHFKWIRQQIQLQDQTLLQLWDDIELQIPLKNRTTFLVTDSLEVKASKVRAWFQNPQFDPDRAKINPNLLDLCKLERCPEVKLLGDCSDFKQLSADPSTPPDDSNSICSLM